MIAIAIHFKIKNTIKVMIILIFLITVINIKKMKNKKIQIIIFSSNKKNSIKIIIKINK